MYKPEKLIYLYSNRNSMKFIPIVFMLFFFQSCKEIIKAPEFEKIDKIELKENNEGKMVLVAKALFTNPNLVGGKFQIKNIEVYIDDKFLGKLNSDIYKVPAKKIFSIPLEISFNNDFIKNNKGNVWDMINKLASNSLSVRYEGKILYIIQGIKVPYSIHYEEKVKIIK